jgi:hypothetical protein
MKTTNKIKLALTAIVLAASANSVMAAGCVSGGAVGAVGGHVAGHHAVLGAVAGCAVGHHMNKKDEKAKAAAAAPAQGTSAPAGKSM